MSWAEIVKQSAHIPVTKAKHKSRLRIVDVAINRRYGGFGLSEKAEKRLRELSGTEERDDPILIRVIKELGKEANSEFSHIVLYKGVVDDERKYWTYHEYDGLESFRHCVTDDNEFIRKIIMDQDMTAEEKVNMIREHYKHLKRVRQFISENIHKTHDD